MTSRTDKTQLTGSPPAPSLDIMPMLFGASPLPPITVVHRVTAILIRFRAPSAQLATLVPRHFELANPTVTGWVAHYTYDDVDYLGGRSYHVVAVSVEVTRSSWDERPRPYGLVLWESDARPIIAGREVMGHAKLPAEIDAATFADDSVSFLCAEYGAPLVRGTARSLVEVSGPDRDRVRTKMRVNETFGWKYVPGTEVNADIDYPTLAVTRFEIDRAMFGVGDVAFEHQNAVSAPFSGRVASRLHDIEGITYGAAYVLFGEMEIDRTATKAV